MRGILVFDQLNDVAFMKTDDELQHHLHLLSVKNGLTDLTQTSDKSDGISVSKDAIVQLFSPLIASQRVMQAQFFNMYSTIECTDGTVMVFTEFSGYLFIGISNHQEETVSLSRRRLGVFVSLVKFLYGPAVHLLKEVDMLDRCQFLCKLLDCWDYLRRKEQMFHLEAVERLLVNNDVSTVCIKSLQKVLEKVRSSSSGEESMCHVFLLVESKLLAFYSRRENCRLLLDDLCIESSRSYWSSFYNRNATELSKSSMLLLILLSLCFQSSAEYEDSKHNSDKSSRESSKSEVFFTPLTSVSSDTENKEGISVGVEMTEDETGDFVFIDLTKIHQMLVFLYSENEMAIPCLVYIVMVTPKLMMVIVSEVVSKTGVSSPLATTLDTFYTVSSTSLEGKCSHVVDKLEANIKRFSENTKKIKVEHSTERQIKSVVNKWEQLKRNGFTDYIQGKRELQMSSRIESTLSSICEDIQKLFEEIVFMPEIDRQKNTESSILTALLQVQELITSKMSDYMEYLTVKAERNVSMISYLQEFPGLVHFMYVDRMRNFLTAPSINMSEHCTEGRAEMSDMIKGMVWKMVEFSRRYLEAAHLSAMWREGDYYFSYFLWFEDSGGKLLKPLDGALDRRFRMLPGIFCGDFYRILTKECFPTQSLNFVNCYELFTIHHANVPTTTVTDQAHRLALSAWEMSGAAHIPIELL